jgi:hypothetical protein
MKIKFSHKYKKLSLLKGWICESAKLLEVLNVELAELSPEFIDYDTDGIYPLPKSGRYMMLIFQKEDGNIFTTLRRFTPDKYSYYNGAIGQEFEVEIV